MITKRVFEEGYQRIARVQDDGWTMVSNAKVKKIVNGNSSIVSMDNDLCSKHDVENDVIVRSASESYDFFVPVLFENDQVELMLVDGGSTRTMIRYSVAEGLGFKPEKCKRVILANGSSWECMGSMKIRVKFPGNIICNVLAWIAKDEELEEMILGSDVLRAVKAVVSYDSGTLRFCGREIKHLRSNGKKNVIARAILLEYSRRVRSSTEENSKDILSVGSRDIGRCNNVNISCEVPLMNRSKELKEHLKEDSSCKNVFSQEKLILGDDCKRILPSDEKKYMLHSDEGGIVLEDVSTQLQDDNVDKRGFNNVLEVADGVSKIVTDSGNHEEGDIVTNEKRLERNNKKKVKMKTETVVTSKPWEGYIMDCDDEIRTREASWNIRKLAVEGVNKPKDEKRSYNEPNLPMGCRVQIRNHKDRSKFTSKYLLNHMINGRRKKSYFVKCMGKKGRPKLLRIGGTKFDVPVGDCVSAEGRSKSSNDLF